jgi:hypothetical protein
MDENFVRSHHGCDPEQRRPMLFQEIDFTWLMQSS